MLNGVYFQPTVFYFGRDTEALVGNETRKYAQKILLHYGKGSIKKNGVYDSILVALNNAGVEFIELGGVKPNPQTDLVYQGIELCRKEQIEFILAVGGGSVIDSAKAISVGVPYQGDFCDFFELALKPEAALKIGVVLTNPGSGSESSCSTVITNPETKTKLVCDDPLLFPVFSILNPEFTTSLPRYQTACGIVDALSHLFERYFTHTDFVDCTDRICEGLMTTLLKYAEAVFDNPDNYDIRSEIMWSCKLAHDATPGFGRKQDWGSHKIAHELGAYYDLPHGAIMGVIFLAWFRHVSKVHQVRLAQLGRCVFNVHCTSGAEASECTIDLFAAFLRRIGMPTTLREAGISDKSNFSAIAHGAVRFMQSGTIGNYTRLSPADIESLLDVAY